MDWAAGLIALLLMSAGVVLGMKARKREFDRTNAFGVERFPTLLTKLASKTKDQVYKGGAVILLGSGILLLSYIHMTTWGWIVWLPIALFMFLSSLAFNHSTFT